MKLPRGLRLDVRGQVVNDLQSQRFPLMLSRDPDADYPVSFTLTEFLESGTTVNTVGRSANAVPQLAYSEHRVTVKNPLTGYRPVTTVFHRPSHRSLVVSYDIYEGKIGGSLSRRYRVENDILNISAPLDFDFTNQIVPRFVDALSAFNANYGTILGEGKETLEMLLLNLRRLREAYRAVRHGDLRSLRRVIQGYHKGSWRPATAGNLWLEFRYGLMPLFHDIHDVMMDWHRTNKKIHKLYRMSFGHGDTITNGFTTLGSGASLYTYAIAGKVTFTRSHRYGFVMSDEDGYATFNGGSFRPVSDWKELATAFLNPVATAWELVPFSFVADWFVNVGDILQQQGQLYRNVSISDGFSRRQSKVTNVQFEPFDSPLIDRRVEIRNFRFVEPHSFYQRDWVDAIPSLTISIDTEFRSIKHVIDSIFLLSQRVKR